MKNQTTEEKVRKFLKKNANEDFEGLGGYWVNLQNKLEVLLKEQDRDTRHACAEEVITLESEIANDGMTDVISVDKAHSVIMNCKGGLK